MLVRTTAYSYEYTVYSLDSTGIQSYYRPYGTVPRGAEQWSMMHVDEDGRWRHRTKARATWRVRVTIDKCWDDIGAGCVRSININDGNAGFLDTVSSY